MHFGKKADAAGIVLDFDTVYSDLTAPSVAVVLHKSRIQVGSATLQPLINAEIRAVDHFVSFTACKSNAANERGQLSYSKPTTVLHFQIEFTKLFNFTLLGNLVLAE